MIYLPVLISRRGTNMSMSNESSDRSKWLLLTMNPPKPATSAFVNANSRL